MTTYMQDNLILTSSRFVKQKEYWLDILKEGLEPTRFLEEPFPAIEEPSVPPAKRTASILLTNELAADLVRLGKGSDLSVYIILLTALQAVMYRYLGISRISIVSPLHASAATADTKNDHLLVCNHITGSTTFKEAVLSARTAVLEAYANQDYPFDRILRYLDPQSNGTTAGYSSVSLSMPSIHKPLPERVEASLLSLVVAPENDGMAISATFGPARFGPEAVRRFLHHWQRLLRGGLDALRTGESVDQLPFMDHEEKQRVIVEFNRTQKNELPHPHVVGMFRHQADTLPNQLALLNARRQEMLTYGCLRDRVMELAGRLREHGVAAGSIVAIMANGIVDIIVAMMGVLASGGAYLPIDPEYPEERVRMMLRDSAASTILLEQGLPVPLDCPPVLSLDSSLSSPNRDVTDADPVIHPQDPAYVMYTSGTTGVPKGVVIEHRNIANLLYWYGDTYGLRPGYRFLQLTEYTFDPSVEDIIGSLVWGATIVPGHREILGDRDLFCEFVQTHRINIINFIPTMMNDLLCHDIPLKSLENVVCGGEPLPETFKDCLLERGYHVFNHYGPTETATDVVGGRCDKGRVALGRPISNIRCYILNGNQPLPVGVAGELCIAGVGVGRGYLNNPELTVAKFVPDPFSPGQRMYRTGDLARYRPDGNIEYLGRIDRQVKLRGFRIELQEVENQLLRHPEVKEAVVVVAVKPDREPFLCAYLVPQSRDSQRREQPELDAGAIVEFLGGRLPYYMVPSCVITLPKMPLTPNGKIDRAALPDPGAGGERQYKAPEGAIEETLQSIWAQALKKEAADISRDDNFFQLGGHSLLVTVLLSKIQRELGAKIPFTDVFKNPTIEALARLVSESRGHGAILEDDGILLLRTGEPGGRNLFFIHDGTGVAEVYGKACRHLHPDLHCWGILPNWRKEIAPRDVDIEDLAAGYINSIKRIQPSGPYIVAGWCIGGTIAFEMARQLELQRQVCHTVIISSLPPDKDAVPYAEGFPIEGELAMLKEYMADFQLPGDETSSMEVGVLWERFVDYLQRHPAQALAMKEKIPHNWARTIPTFGSLDTDEVCWYLNTIRSLYNARNRYVPAKEFAGRVHYIQPEGEEKNSEIWQTYICNAINVVGAGGDHYSLFEEPDVAGTAAILNRVLDHK